MTRRISKRAPPYAPEGRLVELTETVPTGLRDSGPEYVNAFVTFIDVLGFRELLSSLSPDEINSRLDAMLLFGQLPQRRSEKYAQPDFAPMVIQFSDSIVRIQPAGHAEGDDLCDLFIGEIHALLLMQGNLAC